MTVSVRPTSGPLFPSLFPVHVLVVLGIILVSVTLFTFINTGQVVQSSQRIQVAPVSGIPSNPLPSGGLFPKPPAICGNGILESAEQCDDAGTQNGDGCSSTCALESGFTSVCTPQELDNVRNDLDGKYIQTCDIDLANYPSFGGPIPLYVDIPTAPYFTGIYNGNGFEIRNFTYNNPAMSYVGLFSRVQGGGTIVNVTMTNCTISQAKDHVGCIAGLLWNDSLIIDSHASGNVNGINKVGGIVGTMWPYSLVEETTSTVSVTANHGGGFVGAMSGPAIVRDSKVNGTTNLKYFASGGFVGSMSTHGTTPGYPLIEESKVTGTITGYGGFVGHMDREGKIIGSRAEVNVIAPTGNPTNIGGFAGYVGDESIIEDSSVEGTVTAPNANFVGGFVGTHGGYSNLTLVSHARISNSHSDVDVEGKLQVGGFAGQHAGDSLIEKSSANGMVKSIQTGISNIGGFTGQMRERAYTTQSFADVDILASGSVVGGFTGRMSYGNADGVPRVHDSYVLGSVTGKDTVGGFVGMLLPEWLDPLSTVGQIERSYSAVTLASVSTSPYELGGFAGYVSHESATVLLTDNYWDETLNTQPVSCSNTPSGGNPDACEDVHMHPTSQMHHDSTFEGFDFTNVWSSTNGTNYPTLKWEP